MKRPQDEYATALEHADLVTAELARNLLAEAGIPCLLHGPDFDFVELGSAAHASVRGASVLVPRTALARARAILAEAWGDGDGADGAAPAGPNGPGDDPSGSAPPDPA